MLVLSSLSVTIKNNQIINNASLSFENGMSYLISGDNGSGKSTFLKVLANDISSDLVNEMRIDGSITFDGKDICSESGRDCFSKNMCYVSQDDFFFMPNSTILNELSFYYEIALSKKITKANLLELLANLSINDILKNSFDNKTIDEILKLKVSHLSGGQKKLIHIIREIIKNPHAQVFIFDEPLNNLDIKNIASISNLIRSCLKHDSTCIIVSHCKVFPFVNEEYRIVNHEFIKCDYDCKNCFGSGDENGFLR